VQGSQTFLLSVAVAVVALVVVLVVVLVGIFTLPMLICQQAH
jgi:hypothetical protein